MSEKMTYEIYLEVALRFAKKGDFKQADRALATLLKVLRCARKASPLNKPAQKPRHPSLRDRESGRSNPQN